MHILPLKPFVEQLQPYRRRAETAISHHILALDIGSKRIGLAKCDLYFFRTISCGIIERKRGFNWLDTQAILARSLQRVIQKEQIVGIVAGFPLMPDNSLTPLAELILRDMEQLECVYPNDATNLAIPSSEEKKPMICTFWDERNSSSNAGRIIRGQYSDKLRVKKKLRDPLSAALILDDFLEAVVR